MRDAATFSAIAGMMQEDFQRSQDIENENYLFFQKTPFLRLLNIKQTKIRRYFIFRECK
jgi:hypothetical protein